MKPRYVVRHNADAWIIWDHQCGQQVDAHPTRSEARAACQHMNATEQQVRDDQQQSKEETI